MQQRSDHALKGIRRPFRPRLFEYQVRVQMNPTLALFAPARVLAHPPCSGRVPDVGAPLDGDVAVESAGEEDEVEVFEGFYGDVGSEYESVFGARCGG